MQRIETIIQRTGRTERPVVVIKRGRKARAEERKRVEELLRKAA